mgnify:CR=1 FL=1
MNEASINHVMAELESGLHLIPAHMHDSVRLYVLHGTPRTGSFLGAILSNDFMGAVGRADDANAADLKGWAQFLYGYVPGGCYGSPEHVAAWKRDGGLLGHSKKESAA